MKQPDFSMARFMLGLTSLIGFLSICLGVLAFGVSMATGDLMTALMLGGGPIVLGIVVIAMAQLSRAVVVTAETSHAILVEIKAAREASGAAGRSA
ncbi:hypothetical protein [Roseovarius sp.]|uniref:hypothetical protein n=1 Tax=Roseovarius sp. TaxID=1486281 RepID=UPI003D1510E5